MSDLSEAQHIMIRFLSLQRLIRANSLCDYCDLTPHACHESKVKCCPDCTHFREDAE